jgi:hypothetical protein
MPVDEANLEVIKTDLRVKLNENSAERIKLKELLKLSTDITKVDVPDPTPEDTARTKKEMPKDKSLGSEMSVARRDQIYDKIVSEKTALGI